MGKNISIYLDDTLLNLVESSGEKPSKIVQEALKKYLQTDNRNQAFEQFAKSAKELGKMDNFKTVVKEWESEREKDRW